MGFTFFYLYTIMLITFIMISFLANDKNNSFIPIGLTTGTSFINILVPNIICGLLMRILEFLSIWIWPLALSVRIIANITARHLLMAIRCPLFHPYMFIFILGLCIFELLVAFIQRFIFYLLTIIYLDEI